MQYLKKNEIKALHIEVTSKCNVACPMCTRNIYGSVNNPHLPLKEITFKDINKFFPKKFISQLNHVMFCGVYGDPIMAKDLLSIVAYFKDNGCKNIWIHTNGSARKPQWWKQIATYFQDPEDQMAFGIDGLEDTNQLYRRRSNFKKIIANATAFISAGGTARWDFLVFKHNEHQVEEAKNLAHKLGFSKFRVRKTSRFRKDIKTKKFLPYPVLKKMNFKDKNTILNNLDKELPYFNKEYIEYYLEIPDNLNYQNSHNKDNLEVINEAYGSFSSYLDKTNINCIYQNKFQRIYLDFNSQLWPCCFIPSDIYHFEKNHKYKNDLFEKIYSRWGKKFNNMNFYSLEEILSHEWFESQLTNSWKNKLKDPKNPKLLKCARTCGHLYNPILSQTQNIDLKN